ncbi:adenylate kinase [Candidatus Margulisiibacteriota bacterium]
MQIILLGAPGCGKGTLSKKLSTQFGLYHLSTGDMLRQAVADETDLGKQAKDFMDAEQLVPDDLILGMIKELLEKLHGEKGIIYDGFPRTVIQAEHLQTLLADMGNPLDIVINLDVTLDEILTRMAGRISCPQCGRVYHTVNIPPAVEGVCDDDGETLIARADDSEETVRSRFVEYEKNTKPLIDFFDKIGALVTVDSTKGVDTTLKGVLSVLSEKGLH